MCNCGTSFIPKINTGNKKKSVENLKPDECNVSYSDLSNLSFIVIKLIKQEGSSTLKEINKQLRKWALDKTNCPNEDNFNAIYNHLYNEYTDYFQ